MTEEKEQPTPDVETERVEQEQIETAQPTAESIAEKQETTEAQSQPEVSKPTADANGDVSQQVQESLEKAQVGRAKPKKKRTPKDVAQYNQTVSHFAACGRCSYFLAGYRVIHGVENLETAVFNNKAGWLSLSWNHEMRKLLTKSYGIELYADIYLFDGCCSECGRHYTFHAGDTPEDAATLLVQMNNRRR